MMRQVGIEGVSRRGSRRRTTTPDPAAPPAPDRVERCFTADRPTRLWVADKTYIPRLKAGCFWP